MQPPLAWAEPELKNLSTGFALSLISKVANISGPLTSRHFKTHSLFNPVVMGRKPTHGEESNTERASRVRDNKRRHRARQKEYVQELERRLAETREQGIQVTKEVQHAAQKVARENAKLRELLGRAGYTDDVIDAWVKEDKCLAAERSQLVLISTAEKSGQEVPEPRREGDLEAQHVSNQQGRSVCRKMVESEGCLTTSTPCNKKMGVSPTPVSAVVCSKSSSTTGHANDKIAPCKLLSLLAKNPAADITQVPLPELDDQPCKTTEPGGSSSDGVDCSSAYKMLMQYATSDEKMNRIAELLESGCTPSAAGGCKVKNSVVWKALDEECT